VIKVIDELGLVLPNQYLAVILTAYEGFLAYRVLRRVNAGYEHFEYGPLPIEITGHEKGVVSADYVAPSSITFPYEPLAPEIRPDMWWFVEPEKLFHIYMTLLPPQIRFFYEIPQATREILFRNIVSDLRKDFGYTRFGIELVQLPRIHYGLLFANLTNLDLRTWVHFTYGEYVIELVRVPEILTKIMLGKYLPIG